MKRKERVENEMIQRLKNDYNYRTFIFSTLSVLITIAFAGYNVFLAFAYQSAWNIGIAVYYVLLIGIRAYIMFSELKFHRAELNEIQKENKRKQLFFVQSIFLLVIDLALIAPITMMVMQQKEIHYTTIASITIATYTTYKVAMAARNFIKTRKSNYLSVKMLRNINFVDALVSILSLQYTLIMTLDGGINQDMRILCVISSFAIWTCIIVISVLTLFRAIKIKKSLRKVICDGNR